MQYLLYYNCASVNHVKIFWFQLSQTTLEITECSKSPPFHWFSQFYYVYQCISMPWVWFSSVFWSLQTKARGKNMDAVICSHPFSWHWTLVWYTVKGRFGGVKAIIHPNQLYILPSLLLKNQDSAWLRRSQFTVLLNILQLTGL